MTLQAKEVGRMLVVTFGGATPDMTPEDAVLANSSIRRVVIPPVDAETGLRMWAYYSGILFGTTDASAETTAVELTRIACGAWAEETAPQAERDAADARWAEINELRHSEAEEVCQIAIYWNSQGGGMDVVEAYLEDGHPKAQEILLSRNQLWNVYSRLRMLTRSPSSESENETPGQGASSPTATPSGTSASVERDAFGIRRTASES